jgi:RimJ/RimL family protein N-acetyltransferase
MGRARTGRAASDVTQLVTLREFDDADVDAVTAWVSDPAVTRFMTWDPGDRDRAAGWLRQVAAAAAGLPRTTWELAAVEAATGQVVGAARLTVRDARHRTGDIGYVLRRDHWGRGLGTEVARQLVERGFDRVGLHRGVRPRAGEGRAAARGTTPPALPDPGRVARQPPVRRGDRGPPCAGAKLGSLAVPRKAQGAVPFEAPGNFCTGCGRPG